jgi:hypothetical protein
MMGKKRSDSGESKDPMRESAMSFFKEAYSAKPSETMSNFYINQRN